MARVRLYLEPVTHNAAFRFIRPGGAHDSIPILRLRVRVRLTPYIRSRGREALRAGLPECVIDTGSHLSIIPEYIWSHFHAGAITPLPFDPAMPYHLRSVSLGGGNYPYELGELVVRLWDQEQRALDARRRTAGPRRRRAQSAYDPRSVRRSDRRAHSPRRTGRRGALRPILVPRRSVRALLTFNWRRVRITVVEWTFRSKN